MGKLFEAIKLFFKPMSKVLKPFWKVLKPILKPVLKLFSIKRLVVVGAFILIAAAILYFGPGLGLGGGAGDGQGDGNTKVQASDEQAPLKENDTVQEVKPELMETEEQNDSATDTFEGTILSINVVGNDYFYNNERILLESFIAKIQEIQGKLVVEVKDDNGSLRAYNKLLDELEGKHVDYVEK